MSFCYFRGIMLVATLQCIPLAQFQYFFPPFSLFYFVCGAWLSPFSFETAAVVQHVFALCQLLWFKNNFFFVFLNILTFFRLLKQNKIKTMVIKGKKKITKISD